MNAFLVWGLIAAVIRGAKGRFSTSEWLRTHALKRHVAKIRKLAKKVQTDPAGRQLIESLRDVSHEKAMEMADACEQCGAYLQNPEIAMLLSGGDESVVAAVHATSFVDELAGQMPPGQPSRIIWQEERFGVQVVDLAYNAVMQAMCMWTLLNTLGPFSDKLEFLIEKPTRKFAAITARMFRVLKDAEQSVMLFRPTVFQLYDKPQEFLGRFGASLHEAAVAAMKEHD